MNDANGYKAKPTKLNRLKAIALYIILAGGALVIGMLVANHIIMPMLVGGSGDIEVPDLVNMSFEAGAALLDELGLQYEKTSEEYSADIPSGYILAQRPEAGMDVREDRTIQLTISAGSEDVRVPNLVGMSRRQAEDVLTRSGLEVGKIREGYDPDVAESSVIGQNPEPGREAPRGTRIDLLVSLGSEESSFKMPNLIGADYRTAVSRVTTWEMQMGEVTFAPSISVQPGYVMTQVPPVGETVSKGDTVDVVISKGPPEGGVAYPDSDGGIPDTDTGGETSTPDSF